MSLKMKFRKYLEDYTNTMLLPACYAVAVRGGFSDQEEYTALVLDYLKESEEKEK